MAISRARTREGKRLVSNQVTELLIQSLEREKGVVQVYKAALTCAITSELALEWSNDLDQTRVRLSVLMEIFATLKLDPYLETPRRQVIRHSSATLVQSMEKALKEETPDAAHLVACECIVLAEAKHHADWECIGKLADSLNGETARVLRNAYDQIEGEASDHAYRPQEWDSYHKPKSSSSNPSRFTE